MLKTLLLSYFHPINARLILRAVSPYPASCHSDSDVEGPDHYFLRGASVSALSTFFGAYIFQALDESELRKWEKENQKLETTDCVEMQLLRDQTSRHGILKLRIGWKLGNPIVNSLYT